VLAESVGSVRGAAESCYRTMREEDFDLTGVGEPAHIVAQPPGWHPPDSTGPGGAKQGRLAFDRHCH